MADLRFDAAAHAIYRFVYDGFCDWYIELIKGVRRGNQGGGRLGARSDLVMLHPFMPFVTEELWKRWATREAELIVAAWPAPEATVDAPPRPRWNG
jgi:valyl-tRNA synthetase